MANAGATEASEFSKAILRNPFLQTCLDKPLNESIDDFLNLI